MSGMILVFTKILTNVIISTTLKIIILLKRQYAQDGGDISKFTQGVCTVLETKPRQSVSKTFNHSNMNLQEDTLFCVFLSWVNKESHSIQKTN